MKKTIIRKLHIARFTLVLVVLCAAFSEIMAQPPQSAEGLIADLTTKIAAAPNDEQLYIARATVYLKTNKYTEALADTEKAVAINPKNINALNLRGNAKSFKKDYDGAIADFSQVIKLYPDKAFRAYFWRGEMYEVKNDAASALADYTKAIQIEPKFANAYIGRARLSEKTDSQKAIADYTSALQNTPPTDKEAQSKLMLTRSKLYMANGLIKETMDDLQPVAESDTKSAGEAAFRLGALTFEMKKYAAAEAYYKRAADKKYPYADVKLKEVQALTQPAAASSNAGDQIIAQMEKAVKYAEEFNALQKISQPAVKRMQETGELEYTKLSVNLADVRTKLRAEVKYLNQALPELRKINLPPAQKLVQTFENTLRTDESVLSKISDYKIAYYRILGEQFDSIKKQTGILSEQSNALIAASSTKDKAEKAAQLAKSDEAEVKLLAQTRVSREIMVRGMKELETYKDPAWQMQKPRFQKEIDGYDKEIADFEKRIRERAK